MFERDILALFAWLVTLVEILGIVTAAHAVMRTRTSQGAIAWAISLVTFPWVSLPLYAVFGRNKFNGYVRLRTSRDRAVHHMREQLATQARSEGYIDEGLGQQWKTLVRLSDMPVMRHNKCELLINGEMTFGAMFTAMEQATDYILVQFFIIKDDELGRQLADILMAKARQNIRVCLLYDEIGSQGLSSAYINKLHQAGVIVAPFHTTKGKANRFQINFRNHRKIVIVDGRLAFVGGHNVGDEYVSRHCTFGSWRDTHVRVAGPVVQAIQFSFVEDWYWARGEIPQELSWEMTRAESGNEQTLCIASGPADDVDTCGLFFVEAINRARKRIWIASPYFVPDQRVLAALKLAALRGVDIRILLPQKPDHLAVYLASFARYEEIIPLGIKLYRYQEGFMHQKVVLVDDAFAAVGTANMDNRSFRLNFEIMLLNFSRPFINQIETMLRQDLTRCRQVDMNDYQSRSFLFRFAVRVAALMSPIL
ncbi:cardiolipin synthase [Desulfoplanes formicivorans]|uniref:Cardiolipin synthase n=1 Tax=Desulfoplanes formicivorans TaxID=1592317 RepID=A0A194AKL2_9BACT|nr:cardiolipin synthase [Desulfoplanes formicivorans]GAU09249.1 cardiolipin synthetase [Desulfoplanes formicivorans]